VNPKTQNPAPNAQALPLNPKAKILNQGGGQSLEKNIRELKLSDDVNLDKWLDSDEEPKSSKSKKSKKKDEVEESESESEEEVVKKKSKAKVLRV